MKPRYEPLDGYHTLCRLRCYFGGWRCSIRLGGCRLGCRKVTPDRAMSYCALCEEYLDHERRRALLEAVELAVRLKQEADRKEREWYYEAERSWRDPI